MPGDFVYYQKSAEEMNKCIANMSQSTHVHVAAFSTMAT